MKSFTLIETLIVIFVFALILGALFGFIVMAYRMQSYSWEQSVAVDEARQGIETMVRELRKTGIGENGSYPLEKAEDKEIIFYSDIDKDGKTERVRYFLGTVNSGSQTSECQTSVAGGFCSADFTNFLKGILKTASVKVSVDGDFGMSNEYAEIYADGNYLGRICQSGCSDCPGAWQGTQNFDVANFAADNSILFRAESSSRVEPQCPHSMKVRFEFSWTEELADLAHEFRKGVIEPTGSPVVYDLDQEKVSILSSYVRNSPPIFEYFDKQGNKIVEYPARLVDTKLIKVFLVINVNLNQTPNDFELESSVQLRNLKNE